MYRQTKTTGLAKNLDNTNKNSKETEANPTDHEKRTLGECDNKRNAGSDMEMVKNIERCRKEDEKKRRNEQHKEKQQQSQRNAMQPGPMERKRKGSENAQTDTNPTIWIDNSTSSKQLTTIWSAESKHRTVSSS